MITREHARKLRQLLVKASESLTDKEASEGVELFPKMKYDGGLIRYLTRINWNGTIKMAAVDLYDTAENNPDNAPSLWTDIAYKDGYRYIKANMSAAEAFGLGECDGGRMNSTRALSPPTSTRPQAIPQDGGKYKYYISKF